jgi:hypothetical protein
VFKLKIKYIFARNIKTKYMAEKKIARKKKVFIDMKMAFAKIKRGTGEKITYKSFAEENDIHPITLLAWSKEAPKVVGVLYEFLKTHNMKFEELVKKE